MIFLIGHHAAGKTEIATILKSKYNFLPIETGQLVRSYKTKNYPDMEMNEWVHYMEQTFGEDFFDKLILSEARAAIERYVSEGHFFQDVLITGNRMVSGVNFLYEGLKDHPLISRKECTIVGVYADPEILYKRYIKRNRHPSDETLLREDFELILAREHQGITELLGLATSVIVNESDELTDLEASVKPIFTERLGYH